jgi:acetyl esterase/lipase
MRANLISVLLLTAGLMRGAGNPEVPLWANGAPGSEGKTAKEVVEAPNESHGYLKVTEVHNPSLTVYLPPTDKATGAAMIIAPGGGHRFLNFDQEGTYVAEYLASIGVAGFVLKYRLANEAGSTYKVEGHALADAQRAIRLIRSRAAEWHVNPARVGIMGFSAGGEVAALAATRFDSGKADAADPIERMSSRPDFDALIYPGIRADGYTIPKDAPVTFLLCADNDKGPSTALSVLYPKLKAAGVQTEVHVYATGGHGFGINPRTRSTSPAATSWWLRLGEWMGEIGALKK